MRKHQQQQKRDKLFVSACLRPASSISFIIECLHRGADPNMVLSSRPLSEADEGRLLMNLSSLCPNGARLLECFLKKGMVIDETNAIALRIMSGSRSRRNGLSTEKWMNELIALNGKYPDGITIGFLSRLGLKLEIHGVMHDIGWWDLGAFASPGENARSQRGLLDWGSASEPRNARSQRGLLDWGSASEPRNARSILWEDLKDAKMIHLDNIITFSSKLEPGKRFVFEQPGTSWEKVNEILRTICEESPDKYGDYYEENWWLSDRTIPFLTNLRAYQPNMVFDDESVNYFVGLCLTPSSKDNPKIARSIRVDLIEWILRSRKRWNDDQALILTGLIDEARSKKRRFDLYHAWSRTDPVGNWGLEDELRIVWRTSYMKDPIRDGRNRLRNKEYVMTEEERLIQTFSHRNSSVVFYAPQHYQSLVPFLKRTIRTILMIRNAGSSIIALVPNEILFEIFSWLVYCIPERGWAPEPVSLRRDWADLVDPRPIAPLLWGFGGLYHR